MLGYKNDYATCAINCQTIKDVSLRAEEIENELLAVFGSPEKALFEANSRLKNIQQLSGNDFHIAVINRVIRKLTEKCL